MNSRTEPALCSWPASKTDQSKRAKSSYPARNRIFFLLERLNVYIFTILNSILTYKKIVLNLHKICVICREGKQEFFRLHFLYLVRLLTMFYTSKTFYVDLIANHVKLKRI